MSLGHVTIATTRGVKVPFIQERHAVSKGRKLLGNLLLPKEQNTVNLKIRAFWDRASCSLVRVDRRFRGAYGQRLSSP
jgi:hypothetical protein